MTFYLHHPRLMDQPTSKGLPMAARSAESRITLHSHTWRMSILYGDTPIADNPNATELHEYGYPQRQCVPRADVDMSKLSVSSTVTHCPFKGDTTCYSLPKISCVAWCYERPTGEMQAIAGRLAFDTSKVTEDVE